MLSISSEIQQSQLETDSDPGASYNFSNSQGILGVTWVSYRHQGGQEEPQWYPGAQTPLERPAETCLRPKHWHYNFNIKWILTFCKDIDILCEYTKMAYRSD